MRNNRSKKKLKDKMSACLIAYGLVSKNASPDALQRCAKTLEKLAKDHFVIESENRQESMQILSERWFKSLHTSSQSSFRGGRKRHSYYSFAQWIDTHYYIIPLTKGSGWRQRMFILLSRLIKRTL